MGLFSRKRRGLVYRTRVFMTNLKQLIGERFIRGEWSTQFGGIPGLVVMGRGSHSKGRGFESRHSILDGHFSHIFVVKIVMMFV